MWTLDYAAAAERDFELIFDHLLATYIDLGEDPDAALERAARRIRTIRLSIDALANTPHIGTLRPDILPNLRFVRRDHAAVWFMPDTDRQHLLVAAIFFGAQDHIRKMLTRLLSDEMETGR